MLALGYLVWTWMSGDAKARTRIVLELPVGQPMFSRIEADVWQGEHSLVGFAATPLPDGPRRWSFEVSAQAGDAAVDLVVREGAAMWRKRVPIVLVDDGQVVIPVQR